MNLRRKIHNIFHPKIGEIWMLHRVAEQRSEQPNQRDLEVTVDWLEQTMLEYKQKGFSFVSIDNLTTLNTKHSTLNTKKWVCVTFDDGYRDNYTLAYPLLKRLNVPFTVYVTTGFIDNRLPMWWYPDECLGMSTEELRAIDADPLCTIGAHTVSHPKLDSLSYEEQSKEIADSKLELERLLGHSVNHFSFPHGAHNADTLKISHELGFSTTAAAWGGPIRKGAHYDSLPRIGIKQS